VSTQDVTSQVIDVAARLTTQRASVARIQALLAKATTIGEIVSIESELTQREADLESLEAQQAKLGDLTTLSTIAVTLLGPQAQLVVAKPTHRNGFVAGLDRGWHAFLASMAWLLTVLGAILPFAVGIAVVAWLVRLLARRLQARRTPTAPVIETPAPPASGG
jgi:membrane protein insertase Oxa1/YidC/SpoIIIJ